MAFLHLLFRKSHFVGIFRSQRNFYSSIELLLNILNKEHSGDFQNVHSFGSFVLNKNRKLNMNLWFFGKDCFVCQGGRLELP